MFYCNKCGEERGYPTDDLTRSYGNCELCGKPLDCNDIPSRYLGHKRVEPEKDKSLLLAEKKIKKIIEKMKELTDEERMEIIYKFCTHCGCIQHEETWRRCQCWNDE